LNLGPGFKNPTDEEQYLNLSTNYLFQGTSYVFNLDDFYDDANLYKVYTGAKFQTEAFNGTSLEWSGTINNDTITPVNNTETQYGASSGYYPATYTFDDQPVGTSGTDIDFVHGIGTGYSPEIIEDYGDHDKVMEVNTVYSISGQKIGFNRDNFGLTTSNVGTIEFWFELTSGSDLYFRLKHNPRIVQLIMYPTYTKITTGAGDTDHYYTTSGLRHYKIDYDCPNNLTSVWIEDVLVIDNEATISDVSATYLDRWYFEHTQSSTFYMDAIGSSLYPEYTPSEHHAGTYSFTNEAVGTSGADIDFITSVQANGYAEIIASYGRHKKVLKLTSTAATGIWHYISANPTSGTIEMYYRSVAGLGAFRLRDEGGHILVYLLSYVDGHYSFGYGNGIGGTTYFHYEGATSAFPHIKITFDTATDKYSGWIDGVLVVDNENFATDHDAVYVDRTRWYFNAGGIEIYVDAYGESLDPYYTIGDNLLPSTGNLYPNNINMIKGSYDYTDNMKANDASYTTFTSTHTDGYIYETPSQWDDFTFTKGTGGIIGELETIDANYSNIKSVGFLSGSGVWSATFSPDADVETEWTFDPTPHWSRIDEDPDNLDSFEVAEIATSGLYERYDFEDHAIGSGIITKVKVRVQSIVAGSGVPLINLYFDGEYKGWKNLLSGDYTYTWDSGILGDQTDVNNLQVRFKSSCIGMVKFNGIRAIEVSVYEEDVVYDLDVQVDFGVDDVDL
ncbi:hypothetical protein LCGC14_2017190, partial [marine sediment metagenome]